MFSRQTEEVVVLASRHPQRRIECAQILEGNFARGNVLHSSLQSRDVVTHPQRLDRSRFRMNNGVKEFHLVAEPVERETVARHDRLSLGLQRPVARSDDRSVEGDRVRIFVTNKLPEHTTVHWHGMILPNGMDGVGGLTQPHIPPARPSSTSSIS
jgi:hypothetical protein